MKTKQEIQTVEDCAARVLHLIQETIDELRGFVTRGVGSRHPNDKPDMIQNHGMFQRLEEISAKVQHLGQDIEEHIPAAQSSWGFTNTTACGEVLAQNHPTEWNRVVAGILFPLLNNLGRCYDILDAMPTSTESNSQGSHSRKNNKPPVPIGMLSIQQYMDIGVLLECTVVVSILPLLDSNILQPLEVRLKLIPKSLLGRTPLLALHEACSVRQIDKRDSPQRARELLLASALVGNVVHLDRFRPMLLPRHLADVFAAYFQAEQLLGEEKLAATLSQNVTTQRLSKVLPQHNAKNTSLTLSTLQAQAFQTLLLQGRQSPVWLRRRVSSFLNDLATTSLKAVMIVFVHSAAGDKTAASARLARALTTGAEQREDSYSSRLSQQLFHLLDSCNSCNGHETSSATEENVVTVQFVWMVLDSLPNNLVDQSFFSYLCSPFLGKDSLETTKVLQPTPSIHQSIQRINKLLWAAPSTIDRSRFCRLVLLRPLRASPEIQGIDINLIGLLLRLSCTPVLFNSSAKKDAQSTLRSAVLFIAETTFQDENKKGVDGVDAAVVSLCYSLTLTRWDSAGTRFEINSAGSQGSVSLEDVEIVREKASSVEVENVVSTLQQFAEHTTRTIVAPCWQESSEEKGEPPYASLPSRMLEFLLYCYLRSESESNNKNQAMASPHPSDLMLLTAMIEIPYLCELCSMQALLSGSNGQFRLLQLAKTVFGLLAARQDDDGVDQTSGYFQSVNALWGTEESASGLFDESELPDMSWLKIVVASDFGSSLAKILLNLLACMLELGSQRRPEEEEQEIRSLSVSLQTLASVGAPGRGSIESSERAELGDAASHVLTLIAMRTGELEDDHLEDPVGNSTDTLLRKAKSDLNSTEPPFRARGVWTLKNFIMSQELAGERSPLIAVLGSSTIGDGADNLAGNHQDVAFLLLLQALGDSESYVYLGAVHALAAMCCSVPRIFSLLIGGLTKSCAVIQSEKHNLAADQRVKLAEVAIAVLRRSPDARHNASMILELLLYGPSTEETCMDTNDAADIERRTFEFFRQSTHDEEGKEREEEKKLLLKTGGPIFDVEEADVVKSAMISLGAEVATLAQPIVPARYCQALVDCASSSLSVQSTGRLVRRSGAALAATLYSVVVNEMEDILESPPGIQQTACPMTVAMIKAGEENLGNLLRRSLGSETDAGTIARCREALTYRDQAESGGILAAGYVSVDRESQDNQFLVKLLDPKD